MPQDTEKERLENVGVVCDQQEAITWGQVHQEGPDRPMKIMRCLSREDREHEAGIPPGWISWKAWGWSAPHVLGVLCRKMLMNFTHSSNGSRRYQICRFWSSFSTFIPPSLLVFITCNFWTNRYFFLGSWEITQR